MTALLTLLFSFALVESALVAMVLAANAVLAFVASVSVWKAYMMTGLKIGLTLLIFVPLIGILVYVFWIQKKVRRAF